MNIQPDCSTYENLARTLARVPVVGEAEFIKVDLTLVYRSLFKNFRESFFFESANGPLETSHYSIMGRSNSSVIRICGDTVYLGNQGKWVESTEHPLEAMHRLDFSQSLNAINYLSHFWGGWVGFAGYEAGNYFEDLPVPIPENQGIPDLYFMQVERLIVYDHSRNLLKYIIAEKVDEGGTYVQKLEEINNTFCQIQEILNTEKGKNEGNESKDKFLAPTLRSNLDLASYSDLVTRAKRYIFEGDIYQANLSQKFEMDFHGDPFQTYLKLKEINPAPFSGYLQFGEFSIVSSSPERLVKVEDNWLETRPIAGTRPRGKSDFEDRRLSKELLKNEKERAEHLMLVDLERNDLGRICEFGSVKVTDLMVLERYSHVFHIVSNIVGKLKPNISLTDIFKSVFPGGTITGCPKIRSMEIIRELEPHRRGPYSGSFGYIGFSPCMDFNIIIRSLIFNQGKVSFHVGAGIVSDSIPEKEYQETLDKAAALFKVFQ